MQIVAPAGSYSGLCASINAGADAVYLGMPQFGARVKAENFDNSSLIAAVEYAHLFGVKVFVTLNTLIKDSEMQSAIDAARFAYHSGVDAAIVQDLRFIHRIKKELPTLTLHASTQMGIHNAEGAKRLLDLGIGRAVLSRETLTEDIPKIKDTGIDIEFFVQGALCVCFSGNCYFSSLASSYSGNRGKCMQLCRKPYYFGGKKGYYLSAKDLCLYDKLGELEALGVDAIKIEGRMRSDEYAYRAVSVYKSNMPSAKAVEALKSAFNRGNYCSGYMNADAPFNVIYPQSQANIGKLIGKIDKAVGKRITVNGYTYHDKDGYKIMRDEKEICGATVRGGSITADGVCKAGDEVRLTFDGRLSDEVSSASRKIKISADIILKENTPPEVVVNAGNVTERVTGDCIPQHAKTRAISVSDIERAFLKVSDLPFDPVVSVKMTDDLFLPVSALNELRRNAYNNIRAAIISANSRVEKSIPLRGLMYNRFGGNGKILMVEDGKQLDNNIINKIDYIALNPRDYSDFDIPKISKPILLNVPIIMRGNDVDIIKKAVERDGIYGIISNNMYSLSITSKPILLGPGHNIIGEIDEPHIVSFESDSLTENGFVYAFGYAPVMTLCHCPYGKCVKCSGNDILRDEGGRQFAMRRFNSGHCYWQLLNCVPNYNRNARDSRKNLFFDCTQLRKEEIMSVINFEYSGQYTLGNLNKGLK